MAIKRDVRIDFTKRDPVFFLNMKAGDVVDMSQGGVPRVQVNNGEKTSTFVGYSFQIDQWEE